MNTACRKRRSDVDFDGVFRRAPGQKYTFRLGETCFLDAATSVSRRVGMFLRFLAFETFKVFLVFGVVFNDETARNELMNIRL